MNNDIEELTWATIRQREEDARAVRPHSGSPGGQALRSRLARTLVHAGLHLDRKAGELAEVHRVAAEDIDAGETPC